MKNKLAILLTLGFLSSCGMFSNNIDGNKVLKAPDGYYLYYNKSVIKITEDTYITKDKKVSDYFTGLISNKEGDLLNDLKRYFPHGFNGIEEGNKPEEFMEIPLIEINNKKVIDSIMLSEALSSKNPELLLEIDHTRDDINVEIEEKVDLSGKKVEILNANGISGYAKNLGEKLKEKLGVEYNAENYDKTEIFNYVINHKLNENELKAFIDELGLKYIKILDDSSIKPDSDVVIITGDDSKVNFEVEVISKTDSKDLVSKLTGYKVSEKQDTKYGDKNIEDETTIYYNLEDKLIANILAKLLKDVKLVEDNSLNSKIVITTK